MALIAFLFSERNILSVDLALDPELVRKDRWKILLLRLVAFACFRGFFLFGTENAFARNTGRRDGDYLREDLRHVWTSVSLSTPKARDFWTYIVIEVFFSMLMLFYGVVILIFNPKSRVLGKKAQADAKEIELH